jgi:phosphoribosylglycinamide formyltransferase-1
VSARLRAGEGPFPLPRTARLAVLASGRGSNLASLLQAFPPRGEAGYADAPEEPVRRPPGRVALVVSNVPEAAALARAHAAGVATRTIPWRRGEGDRAGFEAAVQRDLDAHGIDLVCLAGFMRILSAGFTSRWAGRIVNVHPSLLPAFRGLHAQRQALRAGVRESGCTIHLVDAGVDTGRVLLQRRVPVLPDDTEQLLAERILAAEHTAYPEAVRRLLRGEAPAAPTPTDDAKEETA